MTHQQARTRRLTGVWGRLRMWWQGTTEITELTRDREREERIIAEASVRLAPSAANIAWLFRSTPHTSTSERKETTPCEE